MPWWCSGNVAQVNSDFHEFNSVTGHFFLEWFSRFGAGFDEVSAGFSWVGLLPTWGAQLGGFVGFERL